MIWFWVFWVVLIAVSFGIAEGWAIKTHRITLSAGFLACHFWWGGIVCFTGH
jgi:hypothetical protein